jgi:aspartate aminotransferase
MLAMAQSKPRLSARISAIAESATLAVDGKAKAMKAAGRPVIGFGAGEPDFPTPDYIVEAAQRAAANPRFHKYSPTAGLPELREAIAAKTARDSGFAVQPSQVLVTNGGKQAVYQAFATLLDPGDEVLLPTPYWTTYPEVIALAGAVTVPVLTDESSGYLTTVESLEAHCTDQTKMLVFVSPSNPTGAVYPPDLVAEIGRWAADRGLWVATDESSGYLTTVESLEAHCTDQTKMLVFVSPSNPTGAVYPPDFVAEIGRWAADRGLWVATDEIYEHLVYGQARFASIPVSAPDLADRCVVLNGVAKTYAMTGWRVGWMIGPQDVIKAATNLQSHATSNVCNVAQAAAVAAVSGDLSAVERMREAFDRRRELMTIMLNKIPGVICPLPEGAFYCFPSVKGVLGKELAGRQITTSAELAEVVLDEAEVAVVPGEAFGAPGYFRLSAALADADLEVGLTRLGDFLAQAR